MEQIQIFDSINNKNVNVYVAQDIAERCRLDANFAAELVRQIEEQNVEEGSCIEIETVADIQTSSSDVLVEKELWSRTETLKFLKLYQKYQGKHADNKKLLWLIISKELARRNIFKPAERCKSKWKNLMRTYKSAKERNNISRFHYYKAVDDLLNGKNLVLSDTDSEIESCDEDLILSNLDEEKSKSKELVEKESWSRYETLRFLKAYQNYEHKLENKSCTKDQLWKFISAELCKEGIFKTAEKCTIKWKNLFRSYKKILEKDQNLPVQRFKYFKEVDDLINKRRLSLPDVSSDTPEDSDFFETGDFEDYSANSKIEYEIKEEADTDDRINMSTESIWSEKEHSKLIWAYKKYKHRISTFPNKEKFWTIISEELESNGFDRDSWECQKEWENLRSNKFSKKRYISDINGDSNDAQFAEPTDDPSEQESELISRNQGDFGYEKIIIETEDAENSDANHKENSWSDDEIGKLISLCVKYIRNNKTKELSESIWERISSDLDNENSKSAVECKTKWEEMLSTYETCKKLNMVWEKYSIFDKIDELFSQGIEIDNNVPHNSCKCNEKILLEKQKRHAERMQVLKRKLDIEERKVKAFEEYVKYIKR